VVESLSLDLSTACCEVECDMDVEEYGRIAQAEDAHWWYRAVRAVLSKAAERRLEPKTGRFLDAGCGPGGNSNWVPGKFLVYGVDIAAEAVAYSAAKRPEMQVIRGSVTALPFKEESFDGVQSITVVCHTAVSSVQIALAEYHRVLRPGGLLLLVEPAFRIFRRSHDRVVRAERRFRLRELCEAVEDAGFDIFAATYFFACLAPAALALALVDRASGGSGHKSDLERPSALDPIFEKLAAVEIKLASRGLSGEGRSVIPFGTSALVVAIRK